MASSARSIPARSATLSSLDAACGTLMGYPDKRIPEGLPFGPSSQRPSPSSPGTEDVHLHHPQGRALLGRQARDGPRLRARARAHPHAGHGVPSAGLLGHRGGPEDARRQGDDARRRRRQGQDADPAADQASARLPPPYEPFLCARVSDPARRPGGSQAPIASAAPYYVAQYVPGERLVLERNRFYKGNRVHHVDRFVATLERRPGPSVDDVASGTFDFAWRSSLGHRRSGSRARAALRRQQARRPVLHRARDVPAHVRPQHEPAALQEQPEAPAGRQLRRRPRGLTPRARGLAGTPPTSTSCPACPASATSASTRSRALT